MCIYTYHLSFPYSLYSGCVSHLYYNDTQFYATAQKQFEIVDEDVVDYHFYQQQTEFTGVAMKNTQVIKTDQTLNAAVDVLNPFIALNYIIYAG